MAALAAPIHSSSGKDLEVPSDVRPAGASDASPRGPLDILADNSQPPTPSLSSGSDAVPKANAGVSKNVVPAGTSVSRPAQFDGLVSEFDKDVSSLLANLASGLLNLKTRQNALTSMPSEKAEKAKPDPAEKVPDEKKAAELISVPKISPDEWVHLFETTGLCQVRSKLLPFKV